MVILAGRQAARQTDGQTEGQTDEGMCPPRDRSCFSQMSFRAAATNVTDIRSDFHRQSESVVVVMNMLEERMIAILIITHPLAAKPNL